MVRLLVYGDKGDADLMGRNLLEIGEIEVESILDTTSRRTANAP